MEPSSATRRVQAKRLWVVVGAVSVAVALGLGLGLGLQSDRVQKEEEPFSSLLGWSYFVCWSVSFWPQIVLNWQRKSVAGMSFDYVWMNLVGFSCLLLFNACLYASPTQQESYKARYGKANLVAINDVFFAGHVGVRRRRLAASRRRALPSAGALRLAARGLASRTLGCVASVAR